MEQETEEFDCTKSRCSTENLSKALAALDAPPSLFMCASAVGFYDNRGDEELDESSSIGDGFLATICKQWEDSTTAASEAGFVPSSCELES